MPNIEIQEACMLVKRDSRSNRRPFGGWGKVEFSFTSPVSPTTITLQGMQLVLEEGESEAEAEAEAEAKAKAKAAETLRFDAGARRRSGMARSIYATYTNPYARASAVSSTYVYERVRPVFYLILA